MRRGAAGAALAATLSACTCASPPGPVVERVDPARLAAGTDTVLTIRGSGFAPVVQADLDSPAASPVDGAFRIEIANGDTRVPLSAVVLRSDSELSAILPAFAAPLGTYDLLVVDPRGRTASLGAALDIVECVTDGALCDDGNGCTVGDVCISGTCVAGGEVVCPPPPPCQVRGVCNPATGTCSATQPAPDDQSCDNGDFCGGATCQAGVCLEPASCMTRSNTPPLACLSVSPVAGIAGTTVFTFDASCSWDAEDSAAQPTLPLTYSFAQDYQDFGVTWTTPSSSPIATAPYTATALTPVVHTVAVEVTDSGAPQTAAQALHAFAYRTVLTAPEANLVLVTTAQDEEDATDEKLSLREAIEYVNGSSLKDMIISFDPAIFANPITIALQSRLPALAVEGTVIAGLPGVVVDFTAATLPAGWGCIQLGANGQMIVGLTMVGCPDSAVVIAPGLTGCGVLDCTIAGPGAAAASPTSFGILVQSPIVVGPRNDISGFYTGVNVRVGAAVVDGNRIHGNIVGVWAHDVDATIQRNDIYANAGAGIDLSKGSTMDVLWFNTIDDNSGDGVHATGTVLDLRDNLLTWNGGFGLDAPGCTFAPPGALGWNGYHANGRGPVAGTATLLPGDVVDDPLYVSRSAADYRLLPASPARGKGLDVGLDVNGPSPLDCDGACDLGAHEYPAPTP